MDKRLKDEIIWKKDQLNIYDSYTGTEDLVVMKKDQLEKLKENGGLDKNAIFLLSWTLTPSSLKSVEDLASKANAALPYAMNKDMTNKQPNIIYLDFIDEKITSKIIDFSYKYSK